MILNTTRDTKVALSAVFSTLVAISDREDPRLLKSSRIVGESIEAPCRIVPQIRRHSKERTDFSTKRVEELVKSLNGSDTKGRGIELSKAYDLLFGEIGGFCFISDWITVHDGDRKVFDYRGAGLPTRIAEWRDDAFQFLSSILTERVQSKIRSQK